jgi:predicted nucleic acid-binding protein
LSRLVAIAEFVEALPGVRVLLLRDPDDEMVAEAAIEGNADHLVTHNIRHFAEVADRISILTPGRFLRTMTG